MRVMVLGQRLVRGLAGVSLPERRFAEVLAERRRLVGLVGLAGPRLVAVLVAGHLMTALAPAAMALATGWLVAGVLAARQAPGSLVLPIVVFAVVLVVEQLGDLTQQTAGLLVARQIDRKVRRRVRELALAPPGIGHLAEPDFQNDAVRASDLGNRARVRSPGTAATGQVTLMFRVAGAVFAAGLVARFSVPLAVALLLMSLLMRAIIRTQWLALSASYDRFTAQQRRVTYWTELAAGAPAAKEVRLFGLGDWVTARRHAAESGWLDVVWPMKASVYRHQVWVLLLALCSAGLALGVLGLATLDGLLSLDALAMYLTAAWGVFRISWMGHEAFDIEYGAGAVQALARLEARAGARPEAGPEARLHPGADADAASVPRGGGHRPPVIRFEHVTFRYPGSDAAILDDLDLEIAAGEVLAVVGVNGAGKTTMMKLLGGLYAPSAGRITIDGVDLATLDPRRWRQRLAVVFQDFVHYPLSVKQNIALGAGDRPADAAAVAGALRDAEAWNLVQGLPAGGDTPLTRVRTGGIDLSGGQWQRIALARALYAVRQGRQVVVLDEPTAHLDVRAEAEFFDGVTGVVAGATVVLISHRLSTIRRADRIVLLAGGRITEAGTHDALLAAGGEYARLFRLQAARFQEEAPQETPA